MFLQELQENLAGLEGRDLEPSCSCGGKCMTRRCECVRAGMKCNRESVQVQTKPLYKHDGRGIYIHTHVNSTV